LGAIFLAKEGAMYLVIFLYFALLVFMAFIKESKLFLKILIASVLFWMYMRVADVSLQDVGNYFASYFEPSETVEEPLRTTEAQWD
jgi:hypothetical protein